MKLPMPRLTLLVFAFAVLMNCGNIVLAQSETNPETVFSTPAKYLVIVDGENGEILFEKNARIAMPPASMTKIMTASVVFERIKSGALSMDTEFTVSTNAWRKGGAKSGSSTMFLKPKEKVSVRNLLHGVIIQSGNDACIVLAEGISGSEDAFADLMNEKAKALGLKSAHFVNSTGWPAEGHVISAYDLAKLALNTIKNYPEYYDIYGQKSFTWNGIKQPNRNPLIMAGVSGVDGMKTGHTKISKYGFIGSAKIDGKRRLFVVNGLESKAQRRSESMRIMRSAFGEFKVYHLYKNGDKVGSAPVFMGKTETVSLVTKKDVNLGMHKSQRGKLTAEVNYLGPIPAPIEAGAQIASLNISVAGKVIKTIPLYAEEAAARKSIFGRALASLVRKIRGQ
ncbi:MAG: D-alanyl-D-alanine carboxypeptidase family protein [Robiginitomaculum sp.]